MRIYWVLRKLEKATEGKCYFSMPSDVSAIMSRWHPGWRSVGQEPSAEEIARLDAFLSNPDEATRTERKLRVVA
jgi:hypothetical protein